MESDKVEKLLEKYFEATTSVSEESSLRGYFSGDNIAAHLKRYAPMFRYFEETGQERSTQPLQFESMRSESVRFDTMQSNLVQSPPVASKPTVRTTSRKLWYTWGSAAAMVLIMVGIYFSFDAASSLQQSNSDFAQLEEEYTQEEIAAAQEALALLSTKFNEGTEQLSHLNEFKKNTNRFLTEER